MVTRMWAFTFLMMSWASVSFRWPFLLVSLPGLGAAHRHDSPAQVPTPTLAGLLVVLAFFSRSSRYDRSQASRRKFTPLIGW